MNGGTLKQENAVKEVQSSFKPAAVEWLPLYEFPEDAPEPYGAFIVVNTRTGRLYTDTHAPDYDWPPGYYSGVEQWIAVSPTVLGSALYRLLHSDEAKALARRIAAGSVVMEEDGYSVVHLNKDAQEALQTLARLADSLPEGIVHDAWRRLYEVGYHKSSLNGLHYINGRPVEYAHLEDIFNTLPEAVYSGEDGRWHFYPGLHELLARFAEENGRRRRGFGPKPKRLTWV